MEPIWPLYLNNDDRDSTPADPSGAAFDLTAGMVTLCRDIRGVLSAMTDRRAASKGDSIMTGHLLGALSARSD